MEFGIRWQSWDDGFSSPVEGGEGYTRFVVDDDVLAGVALVEGRGWKDTLVVHARMAGAGEG